MIDCVKALEKVLDLECAKAEDRAIVNIENLMGNLGFVSPVPVLGTH